MELFVQDVDQCIPICRKQILSEVCDKTFGDIDQVWIPPGHIFITTDNGRRLFTLDCKPLSLSHQHVLDSRNLDLNNESRSILNLVIVSPDIFAVIDRSGYVEFWSFGTNYSWNSLANLNLGKSEILSVTFLKSSNSLVWCEKQHIPTPSSTYSICKRTLPQVISQDNLDLTYTSVIVRNCPSCHVLDVTTDIVCVTTRYDPDQIALHLFFDIPNEIVNLFVGNSHVTLSGKQTEDFHEMIANNLSLISKAQPGGGDLGVKVDTGGGQVAFLSSDGHVEIFSVTIDNFKKQVTKRTVHLELLTSDSLSSSGAQWFLHKGHLGIIAYDQIEIYRLEDVRHVCQSNLLKNFQVEKVISSHCPFVFAWILTSDNLLALQAMKSVDADVNSDVDKLRDEHTLQTDVLRLIYLQELQSKDYSFDNSQEINEIKKRCADLINIQGHSQVATLVAPYMEDYWKLEGLSRANVNSKMTTVLAEVRSSDSVVQSLMENRHLSTSHHTKLLWLSRLFPQKLLDYLCQGINFENTEVGQQEMKRWQYLLGLEGNDLLHYEFVCRLLFQLHPDKLLNFVQFAESVSERTVGVSAFVRKKNTLKYYKAACECLPPNHSSCDPQLAASVHAKLILASESQGCVEKALKHLLWHKLWSEAIQLLQENVSNKEKITSYLHIAITCMAENQVLISFMPELIALFPSWRSILSFANIVSQQTELRKQQLSVAARDIFPESLFNVKLASIKPYLHELLKKMKDE